MSTPAAEGCSFSQFNRRELDRLELPFDLLVAQHLLLHGVGNHPKKSPQLTWVREGAIVACAKICLTRWRSWVSFASSEAYMPFTQSPRRARSHKGTYHP